MAGRRIAEQATRHGDGFTAEGKWEAGRGWPASRVRSQRPGTPRGRVRSLEAAGPQPSQAGGPGAYGTVTAAALLRHRGCRRSLCGVVQRALRPGLTHVPGAAVGRGRQRYAAGGASGGGAAGDDGARGAERDAALVQDARGDAVALAQETEDEVLAAQIARAERARLAQRQLERLLGPGGERRRSADEAAPAAPARAQGAGAEGALDALAHGVEVDAEHGQRVRIDVILAA